jgi:diacylglycerol O-acyltransferase / wax synthase
VAARLHLLPPFHWRLVEVPLGLDHPYWHHEPEFDLEFHIRELALPAPGDARMLAEQVARIVARPLDRARPLWELYLIHGLDGDRVAVLTKVHHAAIDGMSGAEILSVLLDPSPEGRSLPPGPRHRSAGTSPVSSRCSPAASPASPGSGCARCAGCHAQCRTSTSTRPCAPFPASRPSRRSAAAPRACGREPPTEASSKAKACTPRVPPSTGGPHRRVAFTQQSLDEVKQVKNHFGVTVNDVVVAICAGALRTWLQDRGELPDERLLAMIPVSLRTESQRGTYGNRITTMLTPLSTDVGDPTERLTATHEALRSAKDRHGAVPASVLQDINDFIPPAVFARAARVTSRVAARLPGQAPVNVVISNVPGSPQPLYLAGARLEALYPVSAIAHGVGLNITVMGHAGGLNYGVVADRDAVHDALPLATAIEQAHAELLALVKPSVRTSPRSRRRTSRQPPVA